MPEVPVSAMQGKPREFKIGIRRRAADYDFDEQEVTLVLPDNVDLSKHVVVKKDIESATPRKTANGLGLTWINNFGIKIGKDWTTFTYTVIMPAPPVGYSIYYYDGDVNLIKPPYTSAGSGKVQITLSNGDPAIGWGGGGGGGG